jgi:trehalose 6-phosphate synthase/phosphatase
MSDARSAPTDASGVHARSRLLLVSNRLPITTRWRASRPQLTPSSGGLATGLDRLQRRERATWIGWTGDIGAWPAEGAAELMRKLAAKNLVGVQLTADDVAGFYDGFSNGVLWPLFHYLVGHLPTGGVDWASYRRVNEKFADAVAEAWRPGDRIWIHDYHLMLLPGLLRERLQQAAIGFFLHIPFPSPDVFMTLPWRRDLLEGLLGADVVGFHTQNYARHFMASIRRVLAVETTADHLWWKDRPVHAGALPMGIDVREFEQLAARPDIRARAATIRSEARGRKILLGVDRLDYTKGITRRLLAFERLLEREPQYRDKVRFIQVTVPSRGDVTAYRSFRKELDELIGRVNGAFGTIESVPIHYLYRGLSSDELVALYRAADVMVVTPLRDGMNLVAKEFVASRTDDDGVLVLSEFAGAADELSEAITVNPYDPDGVAAAMARALGLDPADRMSRMRALRSTIHQFTVHHWAAEFLRRLENGITVDASPAADLPANPLAALEEDGLPRSGPLTLLIDYDGTLVPYADTPDDAVPDAELLRLLATLASNPYIQLHIVSGRAIDAINRWFWHLPADLWAEHGVAHRSAAGGAWERFVPSARDWIDRARPILAEAADETPGALLEEKSTGLAWHYRMVESELASKRLEMLHTQLESELRDAPVELVGGHKVLELRPRGISKGLIVRQIVSRGRARGPLVAIGDDKTDEDMFSALPRGGIPIRVGAGSTSARYRVADFKAVRRLLSRLLASRSGVPAPVGGPETANEPVPGR